MKRAGFCVFRDLQCASKAKLLMLQRAEAGRAMFKSKEQKDRERYERAMAGAITGLPVLAGKWQYFCETLHFNDDVRLVKRVQLFSTPASKWAYDTYPSLAKTNPIPWFFMLFAAVRSAQTHNDDELNAAMDAFADETKLPALNDLVNALPRARPIR